MAAIDRIMATGIPAGVATEILADVANLTGGTFTGPITLPAGALTAPALNVGTNTSTGIYASATNQLAITLVGTSVDLLTPTLRTHTTPLSLPAGTVGAPGLLVGGTNASTGFYATGTTGQAVAINGVKVADFTSSMVTLTTALTLPAVTGLTAFAGGGQGSATALTATVNRVGTVATIGDSVKLPAATAGLMIAVNNVAALAMDVFPQTGELINALAANTAVRLNGGTTVLFVCAVAGTWQMTVPPLPAAKFTLNATSGATVAAAGDLTGAAYVSAGYSGVGAANLTTRTATQMFNDMGNVQPGDSYTLEIINTSGGTTTLLAGSGVTTTGTMTMATNTTRRFNVKFTSATALVIQSVGVGTIS